MQLHPFGQPVTVLLHVAEVFHLPVVLFQLGQAAFAVEGQAALAVFGGQAANPPEQVGDWQAPAQLLLQQGFGGLGLKLPLIGCVEADGAGAAGQACGATAHGAGQADVEIVLALQPEQGGAAGLARRANADLAADLPAIELAGLGFVGLPLGRVALAAEGFVGRQAGAAAEQGQAANGDQVA